VENGNIYIAVVVFASSAPWYLLIGSVLMYVLVKIGNLAIKLLDALPFIG
jgi:hypothetical protein